MPDYGLLGALGNGLTQGVNSYTAAKNHADEMALKNKMAQYEEMKGAASLYDAMGAIPNSVGKDLGFGAPEAGSGQPAPDQAQTGPANGLLQGQTGLVNSQPSGQGLLPSKTADPYSEPPPPAGGMQVPGAMSKRQMAIRGMVQKFNEENNKRGIQGKYNYQTGQIDRSTIDLMGQDKTEGSIKDSEAIIKAAEARDRAKGRPLTGPEAAQPGEGNAASAALGDTMKLLKENSGVSGPYQGGAAGLMGKFLPNSDTGVKANELDAAIKQHAMTIGQFLQGGVLREGAVERYEHMMPLRTDPPSVQQFKGQALQELISQRQQAILASQKGAGFNVGEIPTAPSPGLPKAGKAAVKGSAMPNAAHADDAPKVGAIEGGHRYLGGDPANPSNWQKVKVK